MFARTVTALVALAWIPTALAAQGSDEERLRALEERIARIEELHADELDELRFDLDSVQAEAEELRRRLAEAPTVPNAFNPRITVIGNFLGRFDDRRVFLDDDPTLARVDDRFNLREVELDFRAAIDPWADAVVIAAVEAEEPNVFETGIEEGYVILKRLPILEIAPAGLKLKVGRFRVEHGRYNQMHTHDLPWMTRPRSNTNFLGHEGYLQNGISGEFFLPSGSDGDVLAATVNVLDGGDLPIAPGVAGSKLAAGGRVRWFHEAGVNTHFELGVSGWFNDSDTKLYGLDFNWTWKPPVAGEWNSVLLGAEVLVADLDTAGLASSPSGGLVWGQYQLGKNVYAGLRYDRAEEITDASLLTHTYGAYLTTYTSEFLRTRIGVEHAESDVPVLDDVDSVFLELNFILGSHPIEPYWVNR